MHATHLSLPLSHPVTIFTVVLLVVLIVPLLMARLRIPNLVSLILSGTLLGPNGLHVLERDSSIILFGTVGLLYIMFLAGLEIDLNDFKKNRNKSLIFGFFTFSIPMLVGTLVSYTVIGLSLVSSLLLASMFASHTLLAYPLVGRLGITKTRSVNITVGGTMITDTAALLVLAVIAGATVGEIGTAFWLRLGILFSLFAAFVILGFPIIGRWFFKNVDDPIYHYIFVLAMVFLSATLAELAGVEAIIGAFLGGLSLNRLIPYTSSLMNRLDFVGNAVFIPFFLLSVGMLVDLRVLLAGQEAIKVAVVMTAVAIACKWLAAFAAQKSFGFTAVERQIMFGLSNAQAAATLAAVMVGFNLGLFDEKVLNGTIMMILVTCLVSTFVVERSGRALALTEAERGGESFELEERLLVPISNPGTIESLIDLAVMARPADSQQPIFALAVVNDDGQALERSVASQKMLEKAQKYASGTESEVTIISRVDLNVGHGILRAAKDVSATAILIGWNPKRTSRKQFFGTILDHLLKESTQTLLVSQTLQPLNTYHRLVVAVPPLAEKETGFPHWMRLLKCLAGAMGCKMKFFVTDSTREGLQHSLESIRPEVETELSSFNDWDDFLILSREVKSDDLFVVISARPSSPSYSHVHAAIPNYLYNYHQEQSFLVLYPGMEARGFASSLYT